MSQPDPFHHDILAALAAVLEQADGMEVDFEPTPQGRRLLATIGVTVAIDSTLFTAVGDA